MPGLDTPRTVSLPLPASLADRPAKPQPRDDEDLVLSAWPLYTPALRYDVTSLEHWLDLNA
jgi:hypothetical protein